MKLLRLIIVLAAAVQGFADTITLRSGEMVSGTYLGGTARQVKIEVGDQVRTFDTNEIQRIDFGTAGAQPTRSTRSYSDDGRPTLRRADGLPSNSDDSPSSASSSTASASDPNMPTLKRVTLTPSPSADTDPDRPVLRRSDASSAPAAASASSDSDRPTLRRADSDTASASPAPAPPAAPAAAAAPAPAASVTPPSGVVELPSGTNLVVHLIDAIDSEKAKVGQTFSASFDEPVMLAGKTVIPNGANALIKLGDSGEQGTIALTLVSVTAKGRVMGLDTETVLKESDSGKRVKIPAGTKLTFSLEAPADF